MKMREIENQRVVDYPEPRGLIVVSRPLYDETGIERFEQYLEDVVSKQPTVQMLSDSLKPALGFTDDVTTRQMLARRLGVFMASSLRIAGVGDRQELAEICCYCARTLASIEEKKKIGRVNLYSTLFYMGFFEESSISYIDVVEAMYEN